MRRFLAMLVLGLISAVQVAAQQAVPDGRFVVRNDIDFYGSDLAALFDVDLAACIRACDLNRACSAFTFNTRSNACFPKSGTTDQTPYAGAVSAERRPTDSAVRANAPQRAAALDFLADEDRAAALVQARDLGFRHPWDGSPLDTVLAAAEARRAQGDILGALRWTGVAVSLGDQPDYWNAYSGLLLDLRSDRRDILRENAGRALSAAINAYLRTGDPNRQASALTHMARALERLDRGRAMIPALRLAQATAPDVATATALEDAIGKYGFRIVNTTVESDAAAPRICAEFSEPLVAAGTDYEAYVRLPDPRLVVQTDDRQLCIDGVTHGARYTMTFRSGLPAASDERLHRDVTITQYVRDRSPSARFPGRAYVLPKSADAALPVETVNAPRLELALRRISDRNLLRAMQDNFFGRPLSTYEDQILAGEIGEEIWTGSADLPSELNRDMTTRLPLAEAIAGQPAGIYALTARIPGADPWENPGATQWFVLSDLGIGTILGTDGLHVSLRSLSDASARAGVRLTLLSRANAVLAKAETDADGFASFGAGLVRGTGGAAPALLVAEDGADDIAFLSLSDPAFDLSDRGVEGRAPAGPVDLFLTTDRGAYRAGERINATVLARDGTARAIEGLPLTAILRRPDGVEHLRKVSDGGTMGGHVFTLALGAAVPRGTWRLDIRTDPDGQTLASQTLLVEDFLPERIDIDLDVPDGPVAAGGTLPVNVTARYLFGAPGADLPIEGEASLVATRDLAEWPGYRFGRHDADSTPVGTYFGDLRTDARGRAVVPVAIPPATAPGQLAQAVVSLRVSEGSGRPVERSLTVPLRPDGPVIGLRPLFDGVVPEDGEAVFDIVALDPDLNPVAMPVRWTLNRIETRYEWYQLYGNWNWEPTTRRSRVATGEAVLGGAPLRIAAPVKWGEYELVVDRQGGTVLSASETFFAGWYAPADSSATPDTLEVSLDRTAYAVGDTARLRIVARTAGTALINVVSNRLIDRRTVELPEGATEIPLPVTDDWGTGAYVTAALIRPMNVAAGQNPARALGLAHATVAPGDKALRVRIEVPDAVRPSGTLRAGIQVDGIAAGETAWLTLAAVDVGILNLTAFESPDPQAHYFGQRRLGVEMRDIYGRLIDGMNGAMGTVRSGGDQDSGMRMQSPPPTEELVAVFSGPVPVGADGRAFVPVDLPAFNGTLRLMAVAWSPRAVGQAQADVLVRDPVVISASMPRFLAPGDNSRIRLEVVHAEGPAGAMELTLDAAPDLQLGMSVARFAMPPQGTHVLSIPVTATATGDHRIDIALRLPDGATLRQSMTLPVRANDPEIATTRRLVLDAEQTFTLTDDIFADLRPGTGKAMVSAGALARFDAPGLLDLLDRYPYGCTEQVTSQAMPLLYLGSVARAAGLGDGPAVDRRISEAISTILTRQASSGGFGLWQAQPGDFWLDAYVADFLSRARMLGHPVPGPGFRMAMDNLRNRIAYAPDFDSGGEDIAYALMVLAREGAAAMGDLRYYADVKADAFATPLAQAQLGAALAAYGDPTRADAMFLRAQRRLNSNPDTGGWRDDYGSGLRDAAGVLALAAEAGSRAVDIEALTTRVSAPAGRRSTQEAAWSLLAVQALTRGALASNLSVNGQRVDGPFVQVLAAETAQRSLAISGDARTDITLTTVGVPRIAPPAGGTGYAITRAHFTLDGVPRDLSALRSGERFVTVLTVEPVQDGGARLMVNDPLPAGVEIDNPSLLRAGDIRALAWLDPAPAQHAEFRSDRFLAAVDLRGSGPVTLAYIARAVTPGSYHHPAASVEDMYRPDLRAHTATGQVTVTE